MLKEFILFSLLKALLHNTSYTQDFIAFPRPRVIEGMSSCKHLEVKAVDRNPHKWAVPLREDVFDRFIMISNDQGGISAVWDIFGDGSSSLFSPLLFGKFFDPSDAFPLWDFESDVLLGNHRSCGQNTVDWLQTDHEYILRADLPAGVVKKYGVEVCIEVGKVVEISGLWKQIDQKGKEYWRTGQWWEQGYVRRVEVPDNANWKSTVAYLRDDSTVLEVRISKRSPEAAASGSSNPIIGTKFQF